METVKSEQGMALPAPAGSTEVADGAGFRQSRAVR